ncbi:unnamed protein product, partial [marine sediment metagenome]
MTFEKFTLSRTRGFQLRASIRRAGTIGLGRGLSRKIKYLREYTKADFYWDKEKQLIGMKLYHKGLDPSPPVTANTLFHRLTYIQSSC